MASNLVKTVPAFDKTLDILTISRDSSSTKELPEFSSSSEIVQFSPFRTFQLNGVLP